MNIVMKLFALVALLSTYALASTFTNTQPNCGQFLCGPNDQCCSNMRIINNPNWSQCYSPQTHACYPDEACPYTNALCSTKDCGCNGVCYDTCLYYCDAETKTIKQKGEAVEAAIRISGDNSHKFWIVSDSKSTPGVAQSGSDWLSPVTFYSHVRKGDLLVVEIQNAGTASATNPGALLFELKTATSKIVSDNSWKCRVGEATFPITKCSILAWSSAVEMGTYNQPGLIWTTVAQNNGVNLGFDETGVLPKWIWTTSLNDQVGKINEKITCAKIL